MLSRLNGINQEDKFVQDVVRAIEGELEDLASKVAGLGLDNYADACSLEVLDIYESELGIKDKAEDEGERRSLVMARWKSTDKVSIETIRSVAESWRKGKTIVGYDNEVIEVRFVDVGIPQGMKALKDALEEVKPAHIPISFIIIYNTHEAWHAFTHNEMNAKTHEEIRSEVID